MRQNNFGCEIVPDGSHEDGDEGFKVFQEWLSVCEDVKKIWDAGWALEQDGPHVATPNQRSEAIRADSPSRGMLPLDLGAPELDVAVARPRKLAFEFCKRQTGGEGQTRRRGMTQVHRNDVRVRGLERRLGHLEKMMGVGVLGERTDTDEDAVRCHEGANSEGSAGVDLTSGLAVLEGWQEMVNDIGRMEARMEGGSVVDDCSSEKREQVMEQEQRMASGWLHMLRTP